MSIQYPQHYSLYETSYGNEVPVEQLFLIHFNTIPSKHSYRQTFSHEIIPYFKDHNFIEVSRIEVSTREMSSSERLFVNDERKLFAMFSHGKTTEKNPLFTITFFYDIKNGELDEQVNFNEINKFAKNKKKANINLIKSDMGHLDTEEYDLAVPDIDLVLNYGKEFKNVHDIMVKRLNKPNDKGIILLHGEPGTGKTSYIKYLTKLVKEKDILFIPPSMAEMLSEPSIIPFLMDHRNTILIIEDAERVISDRDGNGSAAGVSNLLNLTDGILGDCLNIQVIATFNMKRERIDQALLRKGRLIAEHKFEKLTLDETNKLLKHLKKDYVATEGMVLADIYNVDVEVHKSSNKKTNKIGF